MSDLVRYIAGRPHIVDPESQEVFSIDDAPAPLLARIDKTVRDQADLLKSARYVLDDELKARMKAEGERRLDTGAHRIELDGKREWDPDATWTALGVLVEAGLVSPREADEAMPEKTIRRPDGRKLNSLLTRVVGENPVAAQPLVQARSEKTYIRIESTSVDGSVVEEGAVPA